MIVDTGTGHRTGFLSDEGGDVAPATATATATAVGPDADTGTVVAGQLVLVQRCAWTLVWVAVLASGLQFWGSWSAGLWAAVLAPLLAALGIAGTVLVWTVRRPLGRTMQVAGLSAALGTVAVTQGTAIHLRHYYTTDSAAFNQWATRLLLDGRNPYTSSLAGAARFLHPASAYWTYQVDGVHTTSASYPAGSFLLQAPFMALGLTHMVTDWVDLVAWSVTGLLLFVLLPGVLRWLAPMLLLTGVFAGAFTNGGTDALFVPFLVLAVWRWDRFPSRAVPWLPAWVGPVSLGVACSIKQTPWFCVPFLVAGVAIGTRRAGGRPAVAALRYAAWVAGAFVLVNAAFIAWSPSAWTHGTLLPLYQPLVADGQGLVTLALHGITGGVVLPWLTAAAALGLCTLLLAFVWWEPSLRRAWLFLVPVALFLPDRSLANYLLDFVPAAIVAAVSIAAVGGPPSVGRVGTARRRYPKLPMLTVTLSGVAAAVLVAVAFTSAPLNVTVDRATAAGTATVAGGLRYVEVEVTVHNTADRALLPRFMVSSGGGHPNGFWRADAVRGTSPVPPGATTEFVLRPPRLTWAPSQGARWLVEAYTTSPDALSTSSLQYWSLGIVGH